MYHINLFLFMHVCVCLYVCTVCMYMFVYFIIEFVNYISVILSPDKSAKNMTLYAYSNLILYLFVCIYLFWSTHTSLLCKFYVICVSPAVPGSSTKNVFTRLLKVAQHYLLESGKYSVPAKRSPALVRLPKTRISTSFTQAQVHLTLSPIYDLHYLRPKITVC